MTDEKEKINEEIEDLPETGMEAPVETEAEESGKPETAPEQTTPAPEVSPEEPELKKPRRIFRRILIWLVVMALTFAGGFFVDSFLRYQPQKALTAQKEAEIAEAQDRIDELDFEVERLSVFEELNTQLEEELASQETHLTILSARTAVADATLAIAQDNLPEAKLALGKLDTTLETLETQVAGDQVEIVRNLQQRQQLIVEEVEEDVFSALSDLEVLASKLLTLENTLFASP